MNRSLAACVCALLVFLSGLLGWVEFGGLVTQSVAVQSKSELDKLTLANYEKVKKGMTKDEVFAILGKDLAVQIDDSQGTQLWCWNRLKKPQINVIFVNGKVGTKTQFGLK
jgi:outer membrane protein assembly factor BamE (lipoprotein component of BamABCDE complex)